MEFSDLGENPCPAHVYFSQRKEWLYPFATGSSLLTLETLSVALHLPEQTAQTPATSWLRLCLRCQVQANTWGKYMKENRAAEMPSHQPGGQASS